MAGGCIVEGNWFALAVCMTAYRYCQSPTALRLSQFMVSIALLGLFINANQWALAVLPVILIAPHVRISLKRQRHFFYWFYPAHLAMIVLARTAIYMLWLNSTSIPAKEPEPKTGDDGLRVGWKGGLGGWAERQDWASRMTGFASSGHPTDFTTHFWT